MVSQPALTRTNHLLLALIIAVNAYVIVAPLLPSLLFRVQLHGGRQTQLQRLVARPGASASPAEPGNRVIIPSMLLDQPILEGPAAQQYKILDKGIWRFNRGSAPDNGGNTVLVGHRFTYTNPRGVFYNLDKVKMGDSIGMQWNGKLYRYSVNTIREVAPTETSIENATPDARLTLFTCTPLWLPKHRLVVMARLQEQP